MDERHSPPEAPVPTRSSEAHPFDNAIRAVKFKKPVPEIDFTLHTMDDGSQVNTQDRVCKGELSFCCPPCHEAAKPRRCVNRCKASMLPDELRHPSPSTALTFARRGAGTGVCTADAGAVPVAP
jgi:hypothetical protein